MIFWLWSCRKTAIKTCNTHTFVEHMYIYYRSSIHCECAIITRTYRQRDTNQSHSTILGIQRYLFNYWSFLLSACIHMEMLILHWAHLISSLRYSSADAGPYEIPLTSPGVGQERLVNNPLYSLPYEHLQHWRKTTVVRTPNQRCLVPEATVADGSNDCTSTP